MEEKKPAGKKTPARKVPPAAAAEPIESKKRKLSDISGAKEVQRHPDEEEKHPVVDHHEPPKRVSAKATP